MIQVGFCASVERIGEVVAAGFDYIELPLNALAAMTEEDFSAALDKKNAAGLPVPAFNCMFPGTMQLLSPDTADQDIARYLHSAFSRVRRMGGRVAVFGSGKSRARPGEMAYGEAFRRLTQVARLIGETAGEYGVTAVIEPLNRGETNMINSVAEGADLAAAADHPCVKLLADYYHIAVEHQPPEDILRVGGIAHAHIAAPDGRVVPLEAEDGFLRMFSAMKSTNYSGLLSVEGRCDSLAADGPRTRALLRRLYEEA